MNQPKLTPEQKEAIAQSNLERELLCKKVLAKFEKAKQDKKIKKK